MHPVRCVPTTLHVHVRKPATSHNKDQYRLVNSVGLTIFIFEAAYIPSLHVPSSCAGASLRRSGYIPGRNRAKQSQEIS